MAGPVVAWRKLWKFFGWGALGTVLYILLVSHNIAWLNPYPKQAPCIQPSHTIPYGWEYNSDATIELYSSIYFPDMMAKFKVRIARPLKNAVISAMVAVADKAMHLTLKQQIGLAYVLHHLMTIVMLLLSLYLLLWLAARQGVAPAGMLVAWFWLIFNEPVRWAESHTFVFQMCTPVFALAILQRLADLRERLGGWRYQFWVFVYMLLAGCFLLNKQDLAPLLTTLLFAIYLRAWRWIPVGLLGAVLPYLMYRGLLVLMEIPWYNHEAVVYGQGIGWVLKIATQQGPAAALQAVINMCQSSLQNFFATYELLWIPVAFGIGALYVRSPQDGARRWLMAGLLLIGLTYLQVVAARKPRDYMFYTSFGAISLFVAWGYQQLQERWRAPLRLSTVAAAYLALHGIAKVVSVMHFPWRHP